MTSSLTAVQLRYPRGVPDRLTYCQSFGLLPTRRLDKNFDNAGKNLMKRDSKLRRRGAKLTEKPSAGRDFPPPMQTPMRRHRGTPTGRKHQICYT